MFCPFCLTPIFLEKSSVVRPYAFLAGKADPAPQGTINTPAPADPRQTEREARMGEVVRLREETEMAKLKTEFAAVSIRLQEKERKFEIASRSRKEEKSLKQKIEEDFERYKSYNMGLYEVAEEERKKANIAYNGRPDLLEKSEEVIKAFLRDHLK